MDIVLGNYAMKGINSLNGSELGVYSDLLEEPDQDIWDWVSGKALPPQKYTGLIGKIQNDS